MMNTSFTTTNLSIGVQQQQAPKKDPRKDIEQSLHVFTQLDSLYKQKPDHELIQSIQHLREDLISKCKQQQAKLKQIIHQMKLKNEQTKAQSVRIEPESEHIKRMKMLQRELEELNESIFNLERHCQQLSQMVEQEAVRYDSCHNQLAELEKSYNDEMRWGKDLSRMYKYICPIEWDLAHTQGAKGFFKPEVTSQDDLIVFDLTGYTQRQTANRLWDKLFEQFCK